MTVTELLGEMLSSARRAGLDFLDDVGLDEVETGFEVKVLLRTPIPKAGWPSLRALLEEYARIHGWRLSRLRQAGRTLMFTASRA